MFLVDWFYGILASLGELLPHFLPRVRVRDQFLSSCFLIGWAVLSQAYPARLLPPRTQTMPCNTSLRDYHRVELCLIGLRFTYSCSVVVSREAKGFPIIAFTLPLVGRCCVVSWHSSTRTSFEYALPPHSRNKKCLPMLSIFGPSSREPTVANRGTWAR